MSLINWKPRNFCLDFPRWADSFFQDDEKLLLPARDALHMPAVNVVESEEEYTLEVAAPGMQKKDFSVHVEQGMLIVEAQARSSTGEKAGNYTRKEFSHTSFRRSFWLPENVMAESITAKYENGLLLLGLPKIVADKPEVKRAVSIR
ncbi:MAG TPA: Hsp20/alpha crystallin family protein [Saprospiraceae bacterium]|nr:Hsp20/alpha crystallin family protein [Saprospiraceae bacterium]